MERIPFDHSFLQEDKFLNALSEAYRLQESIISATELSIISTNPDGIITSFNRAAAEMLGYDAEEVIGKFTPLIFHDLDEVIQRAEELSHDLGSPVEPGFISLVAATKIKQTADRKEWTYVRKDGSRFPVVLSITALRDDHDILIGYAGIATDITEQKIANEKIKESESHLRALISSLDDIVYEVDETGRYLNAWAKDKELLFRPKREIIGKTLSELYGEKFARPFDEILQKVIRTGESHNLEYKSIVNGDQRWLNAKYSLILDKGKPTKRISISIHDITDRKKAEFALKESEQKFRMLAENIPGFIYLCHNDKDYTMIYLNDRVMEVTGYPKEEFLFGKIHFGNLFHPDDEGQVRNTVDEALKSRHNFHLVYRIKHQSGEWRWMEEHGIGVYGDNQLLWIEGFICDITGRKRAEDELMQVSNENFRMFNNTISLYALSNFDGYFTKVNPAWENNLGWSTEELLSKPFIEFVHPDDREGTIAAASSVYDGNDLFSFENRYQCKDGSYRWLLWTSSADMERKIVYSSALDITERKRSEEELLRSKNNLESIMLKLQEQNRQLDEFAHIISHNLRSPVGNIQALLSFLNENSTLEDFKLIFGKLKNTSGNLRETMNELMDTLKIKKSTTMERVELRFKDVLDKIVQSLEGNLIQCGASVTFEFKSAKVFYPKTYLESIFQNLLSNAIKYRSENRQLEIHFSSEDMNGRPILKVRDNGQGIDMEKYGDKLFGMHKTFHEHKEARGVGLFLTKTQIETMGGQIYAESEVDKGTTFIIEF
ncbi:MAG TPA: PAS domain S-box protein [Cyclobacteriaceae bacterium]|nr:PAS domain S-box protein [Cyclobacteriaceae bacterium]